MKSKRKNYKRLRNGRRRSEIFWIAHEQRTRSYRKATKRAAKQASARNKRLISLYPWLAPRDWKTGKPITDKKYREISLWEEVPNGWTKVFGRMMCDEIQKSLQKRGLENEVYVEQAKEKYGGLRLYMAGTDETHRIISIYEAISEHVCEKCGKPHVPILNFSWVAPYCEDCFYYLQRRNSNFYKGEYKDYAPEVKYWAIPNPLEWTRFSKDEGNTTIEVDISERIKKIEENWEKSNAKRIKYLEKKNKKNNKQAQE